MAHKMPKPASASPRLLKAVTHALSNRKVRADSEPLLIDLNEKLQACDWSGVTIMVTPDERGRPQRLAIIDHESLPMWLVTISPSKVKPAARAKLIQYQREAKAVLSGWFLGTSVAAPALARELSEVKSTSGVAPANRAGPVPGVPARRQGLQDPPADHGDDPARLIVTNTTARDATSISSAPSATVEDPGSTTNAWAPWRDSSPVRYGFWPLGSLPVQSA